MQLFVTCANHLENLLSQELKELGISSRKGFCGVYAPKTLENVYTINYCSRITTRILWPIASFLCRDRHDLYIQAKKIDWTLYLSMKKSFAVDSNVSYHPNLRNSLFAALVVKDAICDQMRDRFGRRPNVDIKNPDIQLNLFIQNGKATLSFDTSGAPLYKRGYRQEAGPAPLQESIAAAILKLAGYTQEDLLYDPFCGSGTFLIEAAMIATNTPAGYFRKSWGFIELPDFDREKWMRFKKEKDKKIQPLIPGKIFGSDKDPKAVSICQTHLKKVGFPIDVSEQEVKNAKPKISPTLVVANPPYGKRLSSPQYLYRDLESFLKSTKARFAILSPDSSSMQLGPSVQEFALSIGGLKVKVYTGSTGKL